MNKRIPIFDLTRLHKSISRDINSAINRVMKKGIFILGEEVSLFEKEFASYIGVGYAIGVASGTDALTLSLQSLGITPKDEVILPANAYPTAFGVAKSGARIRLVDVNGDSGTIDVAQVKKAITKRTKAVIPVHLYGHPAPMREILHLTSYIPHLAIIEDAAQAHGAMIDGEKVGSFGDIGIFSFYPSKNLGALGDGGMVVTKSKSTAEKIRMLRMYGETKRYQSSFVSGVSRLDELQAAVLRVKLRHLNAWNKQRRMIAKQYTDELAGVGDIKILSSCDQSANHLFVIRTKKRHALQTYLASRNIMTAIHYPNPIHTQKAFRDVGYKKGDYPISEAMCNDVLSLPMFIGITTRELHTIIADIRTFFRS